MTRSLKVRLPLAVCALALGALTGCNLDWLTGVPGETATCEPEVLVPVDVEADSVAAADSAQVPGVLVGYCVVAP